MYIGPNGALDVWDGNQVNIDALNGSGAVTKGQGGNNNVSLNVGVAGGSGSFSGVIQNPQTQTNGNSIAGSSILLIKSGAGVQVLTGSNTFTGPTTVNGGTLQVGNGGSGASIGNTGGVTLANNSALVFNHADNVTFGGWIGGNGNVTKTGPGTLTLSAISSYVGQTSVNQGVLKMAAPVSVAPGNFDANGQSVNGYQDSFNTGTLSSEWQVVSGNGAGTNPDPFTLVHRRNSGYLHVTTGQGDPNHLLYEPNGLNADTNWTVLALVQMNNNFTSGNDPQCGGIAVRGCSRGWT